MEDGAERQALRIEGLTAPEREQALSADAERFAVASQRIKRDVDHPAEAASRQLIRCDRQLAGRRRVVPEAREHATSIDDERRERRFRQRLLRERRRGGQHGHEHAEHARRERTHRQQRTTSTISACLSSRLTPSAKRRNASRASRDARPSSTCPIWPAGRSCSSCEPQQPGGAFKIRGATNMLMRLSPEALRARRDHLLVGQSRTGGRARGVEARRALR